MASGVRVNLSKCEYGVLKAVAEQLGWEVSYDPEDFDCDLYWQDGHLAPEELARLRPFQRVNHFPGIQSIARKDMLGTSLKRMQKVFPRAYNFFPPTWVLPSDLADFKAQFNSKRAKTFIVKPEASSQGRGIFLTRMLEQVPEHCVVQRYFHKPFLIDGLKFDLRVYVLLASCDPLRLLIHREGLVRFATKPYMPPLSTNLDDVYMHLTNYAINKTHPSFAIADDFSGHKRSLSVFFQWLHDQGYDSEGLWGKICDVAVKTLCLAQPTLSHTYRTSQPNDPSNRMCFQIIGLDIFVDYRLRPYVLEVNHTPSFATDSKLDLDVKTAVLTDTLKLQGITGRAKAEYFSTYQAQVFSRAVKGIKEMREHRLQVKSDTLKERKELENKHVGGFQLIYPRDDCEEYDAFIQAVNTLSTRGKPQPDQIKRSVTKDLKEPMTKEKPRPARKIATPDNSKRSAALPIRPRPRGLSEHVNVVPDKLPVLRLKGNFVTPKVFAFSDYDNHS